MPAPTYVPITDLQLAPEAPWTSSLAKQMRDNMISVIQGGAGAPRMGPGLLSIGGGMADLVLTDAWAPTLAGHYDFESDGPTEIITPATWPWFVWLRVLGDVEISTTITMDGIDDALAALLPSFGGFSGASAGSGNIAGQASSGGGSLGAGGAGFNHTDTLAGGLGTTSLFRRWARPQPLFGGRGGTAVNGSRAKGGGCLILMVDGNLDMTGGTLDCSGKAGTNDGTGAGGAGAGGSLFVYCSKQITGGTFKANGGVAGSEVSGTNTGGGGAGAGYVGVVAKTYGGTQTLQANGSAGGSGGGNSGTAGNNGVTEKITLSDEFINALVRR